MDPTDAAPTETRPLPGHETQPGEMACPACGRFVGAAVKCPYCGAKVAKRMSLVALRWAAVLLSTVGLVLLYLMARSREPELIRIGDIETTMNFGVVRLAGEVKNDPRPFKNGNGMSFNVGDGSGSIIVFVDQSQRKWMVEAGLVPRRGDDIDFVAQLQASSSGKSARIRGLGPEAFKLTRGGAPVGAAAPRQAAQPAAAPATPAAVRAAPLAAASGAAVPFSAVDESLVGKTVVLEGTVNAVRDPAAGTKQPHVLALSDGTDTLYVKVWPDQYLQIADPESLPGAAVRVKVAVKPPFRDKVDLVLRNGADLRRVAAGDAAPEPAPAAEKKAPIRRPPVPVSSISADAAGSWVTVEGALSNPVDCDGKGTAYTLTDDSGSILVVFWNTTVPADLREKAAAAPRVRVNGKVKDYNGTLEVVPGATGVEIPE